MNEISDVRVPPNDISAEAAVLSAAMLQPEAMATAAMMLLPEHFYAEAHRRVWEAALEIHGRGQPVDVVQIATWLKDRERIAQIGGMAYLTDILNAAPSVDNVESYARTVREKSRIRSLAAVCQRIAAECYVDFGDAKAFIERSEQAVYEIARDEATRPKLEPLLDVTKTQFREWSRAFEESLQTGNAIGVRIPSGFDRLDRLMCGHRESDLTVIGARPGMGKSAWALALAVNAATCTVTEDGEEREVCSAIFSMEMPKDQISSRAVCSEARIDLRRAMTGAFMHSDWPKLTSVVQSMPLGRVFVNDKRGLTLLEVSAMVRETQRELARRRRALKVVVVDYMQLMRGVSRKAQASREQEVSEISRGLKELAGSLRVHVIALSQLNREVEKRQDKRPMLSDLRESGAVEQDADNICFLYRDDYYNENSDEKGVTEVIVAKQRNGATGTVKVRFDKEYTRFDNLGDGEWDEGLAG